MGFKKKWLKNADENVQNTLLKLYDFSKSYFNQDGGLNLSEIENIGDLEHCLGLLLNALLADEKGFGADFVIAIKIEVIEKKTLKYWGEIHWLMYPENHLCHRNFQDPFYGEFNLINKHLEIAEIKFGDNSNVDLDSLSWIETNMDWMYVLK